MGDGSVRAGLVLLVASTLLTAADSAAQTPDGKTVARAAAALTLRSSGPAVMGGRIADIAVHPTRRSTWYVAAGSGGLWKTTNAGITSKVDGRRIRRRYGVTPEGDLWCWTVWPSVLELLGQSSGSTP